MPLIIGLAPISIKNCDNNPKRYFAHHFETNQLYQYQRLEPLPFQEVFLMATE